MSDRSGSSSDDDTSSDEDGCQRTSRKFELSRMIEDKVQGAAEGNAKLSGPWSFILDDGLFERRANFSTTADLWRHLDKIDGSMTKLRLKSKKGSVRLFRPEYEDLATSKNRWESACAPDDGGRWVFRFNRKFSLDLSNLWVDIVLSAVTEALPRSELVAGCIFTTRKGKSEMEIWSVGDPMAEAVSSKGEVVAATEKELQLSIRRLLKVEAGDKTIAIAYKSHRQEQRKANEYERVMQVQQKKDKSGTWPMARPAAVEAVEAKESLAAYQMQIEAGPYEDQGAETRPFQYQYDDVASPLPSPHLTPVRAPATALKVGSPAPSPQISWPPPAALPLAELQMLQLDGLRLQTPSDTEPECGAAPGPLDLSLLRTRLDSVDVKSPSMGDAAEMAPLAHLRTRLDSAEDAMPPSSAIFVVSSDVQKKRRPSNAARRERGWSGTSLRTSRSMVDMVFEKQQLLVADETLKAADASDEGDTEVDPLAFLDAQPVPKRRLSLGGKEWQGRSPPALVLGTNPPDYSSPLMMAALDRVETRRAKYQTM